MHTHLTESSTTMAIPPPDPREQRVVPRRPVEYPETPETIASARQQQREDRCEAGAELDDPLDAQSARMVIVILCERFGPDRVHRWVRNQGLIQDGVNYCERGSR